MIVQFILLKHRFFHQLCSLQECEPQRKHIFEIVVDLCLALQDVWARIVWSQCMHFAEVHGFRSWLLCTSNLNARSKIWDLWDIWRQLIFLCFWLLYQQNIGWLNVVMSNSKLSAMSKHIDGSSLEIKQITRSIQFTSLLTAFVYDLLQIFVCLFHDN